MAEKDEVIIATVSCKEAAVFLPAASSFHVFSVRNLRQARLYISHAPSVLQHILIWLQPRY